MVRFFYRPHFKSFWRGLCACLSVCLCVCSMACIAFADNLEVTEYETETSVLENQDPAHILIDNWPTIDADSTSEVKDESLNIISVDVIRSSSPVTPNDVNGLKKILLQLIGDYEMVTAEYTYTSTNGYTSKQVTTEPDYAWMITAALFIIVLFCVFRMFGGIFNGKR